MKGAGGAGRVRIQAGKWKGRALPAPAGARPTSGRARAALFDLLGPERLAGSRVLDLYAGSGAVGLEAVSRGAAAAVLVERDGDVLTRILDALAVSPEEVRVAKGTVDAALARMNASGERFDLVFADPPYGADAESALDTAAALLAAGGVMVVQTDADEAPRVPRGLVPVRVRAYGRNVFHFFGML